MQVYRTETTVSPEGELVIRGVPFRPGEKVEVIVIQPRRHKETLDRYPLRGKPFRYERPFDSVAEDEWQALR